MEKSVLMVLFLFPVSLIGLQVNNTRIIANMEVKDIYKPIKVNIMGNNNQNL